jgi:hypothetical protein
MGAAYENFTGPLEDEFVQALADSEGWAWGVADSGSELHTKTARFLSKIPFIGKHFAVTEQIPTESEA